MTLTIQSTINKSDFTTIEGNESEILNVIRERFSNYISIISFRMELKNGQSEWFGFDYGSNFNIKIKQQNEIN